VIFFAPAKTQKLISKKSNTAKDVLPNTHRTQAPKITLGRHGMVWCRPLLLHAVCSERIPLVRCRRVAGVPSAFLSLVTLTFDLDIQTRPSEGPNTSNLWISRKSVQRFPRYVMHKQKTNKQTKKSQTALKQNL